MEVFYMNYFKLQKAFKLYVYYIVLWMYNFMDLFNVSSSPGKKEETTKEEEEGAIFSHIVMHLFIGK